MKSEARGTRKSGPARRGRGPAGATWIILSALVALGACEAPASAERAPREPRPSRVTIVAINPASGPVSGGERVLIEGAGFRRGMSIEVYFGTARCPIAVVEDGEHLLVTTPEAARPGRVPVRLRLAGGYVISVLAAYEYVEDAPEDAAPEDAEPEAVEPGSEEGDGDDGELPAPADGGGPDATAPQPGAPADGASSVEPRDAAPEAVSPVPAPPTDDSASETGDAGVSGCDEVADGIAGVDIEEEAQRLLRERFADQLGEEEPEVPEGMGAIFVPALTEATLEPPVDVYRDGGLWESTTAGRWIFVDPGRYLIRVGRGNDRVRPSTVIEVEENDRLVVEPTWGAVVIDVVDERNTPHRGSYDLIRLDTRETVGQGRGADRRSGEGLRTWLLIPGVYKIVPPGGTYRERVDFATVRVLPGEAINYTLVINPETGAFRGAGISTGVEPTRVNGVELRGSLGGALEFTHAFQTVSDPEGITFGGDVFADFDLLYDERLHFVSLQLQVEAGMLLTVDGNWRKTLDYVDLATVYILQLHRRVGPYLRASYTTQMIPSYDYFDQPTTVQLFDPQGRELEGGLYEGVQRIGLGGSFSENDVREGVGVNWRAVRSHYLDLDLRLGVGFQQLVTRDLFRREEDLDVLFEDPLPGEPERIIAYQEIEPFTHREGVELGVVAAGSLTGWLSYDLEIGLLEPFDELASPVVDIDLSITIRIFSFASLNYTLRVERDATITRSDVEAENWQIEQMLLLRFAFSLF